MADLESDDIKRIDEYYTSALELYGADSPRAIHWLSVRNQIVRFDTLCKIGDLNNHSVLDVGCGVGDLYPFINERFKNVNYKGIDLIPAMVTAARKKYPIADISREDVGHVADASYDYVLSSGAMTFHVAAGREYYYGMIRKLFAIAKKGVAFNMLDEHFYKQDARFLPYRPEDVAEECKKITSNYQIILGYIEGDFTVFLNK